MSNARLDRTKVPPDLWARRIWVIVGLFVFACAASYLTWLTLQNGQLAR
jgi:hypothetical protein